MLKRLIVLLAFASSMLLAQDTERVAGASLVTADGDLQALYVELLGKPCDQDDFDLFLAMIDPMETWAKANTEAWNGVETSEAPLKSIFALGLWPTVEVTAPEFVALLLKISSAKEIAGGGMNVAEIKQMAAFFEGMAKDESMSEAERKEAADQVAAANKMIVALETYPAANLELYRANQAKVDAALARFESMGEEGAEAPKEGGGD